MLIANKKYSFVFGVYCAGWVACRMAEIEI